MLVREAMTCRAETIAPSESLQSAARRMKDRGIGSLVVCEGERIVGVITDRDIVVRALARGADPAAADVRSTMTPQVIECAPSEDLEGAVRRMERGAVRRIVVVDDDGHLAGVLSADDVALRSPALAGEILEHSLAPERPVQRGPWPWWEDGAI